MDKHQHKDKPSRIEMSEGEVERLIAELKASNLRGETQELLVKLLLGWRWLNEQLESKTLSIRKLLRLFFGSKTEKTPKPKNDDDSKGGGGAQSGGKPDPKPPKPKPPGHGKNGQAQYESAERVAVPHPTLKAKDPCPSCLSGRLYGYGLAAVLRIFGQAPLQAKVYELERLRCASCQEVFTAPLSSEAGPSRHHSTANAMVGCLNYGAGFPFYRLEGLQEQLGVPLADSTQFDMVEKVANCGLPIFEHMKSSASDGQQQSFDDTPMPVLAMMAENKAKSEDERKGMQTTAILAKVGENKIALFLTGRKHAGENMGDLLAKRDPSLAKVIQMSDASANNFSHEFMAMVIKALCLDHGRRNFHDLLKEFPKDCQHVIAELGKVYKFDADAKAMGLSPTERLLYHQEHSQLIMNGLNCWMEEKLENREVEPNSNLGKEIEYFLNHWNGLTAFLRIEGASLSNAEVERLIKRCVLRRRASKFYKTEVGAWIGDIITSLIETARINGKNQFHYLVAIQDHARHVREHPELWLPWNYQQTLVTLS